MPSYYPPKINTEFIFYAALVDSASRPDFKASPTIAAGDFKVSTDGGALGNLATLPTVTPAAGVMVKFTLSASEMNGDNVTVVCIDAAGAEWDDLVINIQTSARKIDDLAYPTTTGRSIDVTATGAVGIDWANVENPTTAVDLSGTDIQLADTVTNVTNQVTADITSISGDTPAADNAESFFDGTGYAGTGNVIPTVTTLTNKTGFSLSTAGILAIWHQLTSAVVTASTMGKLIVDNLNATISSRMATTHIDATLGKVDGVALVDTTTTNTDMVAAAPTAAAVADAVWDEPKADHTGATTFGDLATDLDTVIVNIAALNDVSVADILTTQMTEAYAADGVAPTIAQALHLIQQHLTEFAISGTTYTTKKIDGATTAATFTLDDASNPTSSTRAT